jgi:hypothetical protein
MHQSILGRCWTRGDFRSGSKVDLMAPKSDFRYTPETGLRADIAPCPKGANKRLMQRMQIASLFDRLVGAGL